MSAIERASQKKKQDMERTRRLSTVNMVLAGNGGDSPSHREESGEKTLSNAMTNLTVHQAAERGDREREREKLSHLNHASNSSTSSLNGSHPGPNAPSKDTFLNYFFGPQQRMDRPTLQESPHRSGNVHNVAKEMVMPKTVLDGEPIDFERKVDHSADHDEYTGLNEREDMETQLIRSLITSYFNITRKSIQDLVPKAVMHLLVNYSRETVQNRLVAALYKEELFNDLLQEDDNLSAERAKCKAMLDVFKNAFTIINEAM